MAAVPAEVKAPIRHSLVEKFAGKYSLEPAKLLGTLKATAFKVKDGEATNEQMAALLVVADQYGLNPFTKEIYAYPDKQNGIVPVVGVDGWARIINEHPQNDGIEFNESDEIVSLDGAKPCPKWIEVVIHRKDRTNATVVREYLDECYRPPFQKDGRTINGPWQSHTKRLLRHKTLIQGARIAFGFVGIYEDDEAERIIERDVTPPAEPTTKPATRTAAVTDKLRKAIDVEPAKPAVELKEPVIDLATIVGYIEKASSEDIAIQALDLARGLSAEERAAATEEFNKRFRKTVE